MAGSPILGPRAAPSGRYRVLQLVTRLNIGGPAHQVNLLARGIAAELPTLVAAGRAPGREGELVDPEVHLRRVPLVRPLRPPTDLRALVVVRALLRESGVGVVHTHMAKAGAVGRLAALTSWPRPRVVHTFHGHVLQGYFGGAQQQAFLRLERLLARRSDVLVAVSPEVRDELLDLGVGVRGQYRVIPLGLDLKPFLAVEGPSNRLRSALGLGADVPLAGVLGRLVPVKDHATLFSALALAPGVHLAVLGDGELRSSLEGLARELRIGDRVHFTGWCEDVPAALADLDVVVLSSRNEGTPVALVEALAASRPVVATDVGGVRHVVQHGETGWLCRPGDVATIAALLQRVVARPDLAAPLAAEGRRRVVERFDQGRMLSEHLALYQELLGQMERHGR